MLLQQHVTAVIPTHNRPRLLGKAIASALAQRGVEIEVVVVDDGSCPPLDPGSVPSGVTLVRVETAGGVSSARNLGIERVAGRWVAFLDDDDVWSPDHVSEMLAATQGSAARFAYSPTWTVQTGSTHALFRNAPSPASLLPGLLRENMIGTPSCVLMETSLLRSLGGFDPSLSVMADWDLWIRAAMVADSANSDEPTCAYLSHGGNMSRDLPRVLNEFAVLRRRYRMLCVRYHVVFGHPGFSRWIAGLYRDQNRRGSAALWYLRSAWQTRASSELLRAVGVLLGERAMRLGRPRAPAIHPVPSWMSLGDARTRTREESGRSIG